MCQVPTNSWKKWKGQARRNTMAWLWQGVARSGTCHAELRSLSSRVPCHPQHITHSAGGSPPWDTPMGSKSLFVCLQVIPEALFWQQALHCVLSLSPQAPEDLGLGVSVSSGLCPHDQWSVLHVLPTWRIHCHRVSKQGRGWS